MAKLGITLTDTDTATVTIGTTFDNNWAQNVTVKDTSGDGFVTLVFNTYTAGTSDDFSPDGSPYTVYSTANSDDRISNVASANGSFVDPATPAENTLASADYSVSAIAGSTPPSETADTEDAVATLSLAPNSPDRVTTYVAPDARESDVESVADIEALQASDNLTEASEIADEDLVLAKIDVGGLEGVLRNQLDREWTTNASDAFFTELGSTQGGGIETIDFHVNQTNPGTNAAAYRATLNVSNAKLFPDWHDDTYWLLVDTDEVAEFSDADGLETNFTAYDEDDLWNSDHSILDSWSFASPSAAVDTNADIDNDGSTDELTVRKADAQEITGTANVAPGTELTVRVTGTDASSPFVKPLTARVRPDGTWRATGDFSGNAQGANFTVTVRRGNTELVDERVDGRIEAAPTASVTFNDQESFGSTVTVASVTTSDGGFLAIHLDNASGEIIGNSSYLEAGTDSDVAISLDRTLDGDATLVAMAHQDTDGGETFDFQFGTSVDAPYSENGSAVTDSARITVTSPAGTTSSDSNTEETTSTSTEDCTETPTDQTTATQTNPDTSSGADTDTSAGADTDTSAGTDTDTSAGTDTDTSAGIDPVTSAGIDPSTDGGADTGTDGGADTSTDGGANTDTGGDGDPDAGGGDDQDAGGDGDPDAGGGGDPDAGAGGDTGTGAGADTGTGAGADTGTGDGADTGTGDGADTGTGGGGTGGPATTSGQGPGFGVGVGVVALLIAVLLAARRND